MGRCEDLQFATVADLLDAVATASGKRKVALMRQFRERYLTGHRVFPPDVAEEAPPEPRRRAPPPPPLPLATLGDPFSVYRLLLPKLDAKRAAMGMKEKKLAAALCKAAGLNPETNCAAKAVVNWRTGLQAGGRTRYGAAPGSAGALAAAAVKELFPLVCEQEEEKDGEYTSLTVGTLNTLLDALAAADDPSTILTRLYRVTSPRTMGWITRIVLGDTKAGLPSTSVLKDFHPHAQRGLQSLSSMERVLADLADPNARCTVDTVMLGHPAMPQKGRPAASPEAAAAEGFIEGGPPFAIDSKLDGYRIQVHLQGGAINYFSPSGHDHGGKTDYRVLDDVVRGAVVPAARDASVLDGEMVIWNKVKGCFDPFGGVASVIKAASDANQAATVTTAEIGGAGRNGVLVLDTDPTPLTDCEIVYCCFDILRLGVKCMADEPLAERQALLRHVLVAAEDDAPFGPPPWPPLALGARVGAGVVTARVEPLLPGRSFMGGPPASVVGADAAAIKAAYDAAVERGEEGVMVKSLASKWAPANNRSWCKLKPEHASCLDIDAIVLAARYGKSQGRSGLLAEYILGLRTGPASPPRRRRARHVDHVCARRLRPRRRSPRQNA